VEKGGNANLPADTHTVVVTDEQNIHSLNKQFSFKTFPISS